MAITEVDLELRLRAVIVLWLAGLAVIAAVVVFSDAQTRTVVRRIPACAHAPHSPECQRVAVPVIFEQATPAELDRYQRLLDARRRQLHALR